MEVGHHFLGNPLSLGTAKGCWRHLYVCAHSLLLGVRTPCLDVIHGILSYTSKQTQAKCMSKQMGKSLELVTSPTPKWSLFCESLYIATNIRAWSIIRMKVWKVIPTSLTPATVCLFSLLLHIRTVSFTIAYHSVVVVVTGIPGCSLCWVCGCRSPCTDDQPPVVHTHTHTHTCTATYHTITHNSEKSQIT